MRRSNLPSWSVPDASELSGDKFTEVSLGGVAWPLAHLDELVIVAFVAAGALFGSVELVRRDMPSNAVVVLLFGLCVCVVLTRQLICGLAVSLDGVRVRRLFSTTEVLWIDILAVTLTSGPWYLSGWVC